MDASQNDSVRQIVSFALVEMKEAAPASRGGAGADSLIALVTEDSGDCADEL